MVDMSSIAKLELFSIITDFLGIHQALKSVP